MGLSGGYEEDRKEKEKMKVLCVGDIHAKPWVVHAVEKLKDDYDRIIFLGDYVDDWSVPPELSYDALKSVCEFYAANKSKVIMLRGNHDFSEYYGYRKREFACSGLNYATYKLCAPLYDKYWKEMVSVWTIPGNPDDPQTDYWFSHAGITSGWYKEWSEYWDGLSSEQKAKSSLLDTEELFSQAGMSRGGASLNPSPIWADREELVRSPKAFINQVVGHTPGKTVTCHEFKNGDGSKNRLFFCDTFSTYSNGMPYGDDSCLSLDTVTGEWEKIYPMKLAEQEEEQL